MRENLSEAVVNEIIRDKEVVISEFYWYVVPETTYIDSHADIIEPHDGYVLIGYNKKVRDQLEIEFS